MTPLLQGVVGLGMAKFHLEPPNSGGNGLD